jgi:DNA helicase II / ATP-dependent DNA helicase PcrA
VQKDFETARAQLNQAQREAVDTIDGPVLVIAGPGTGKTQLLSLRVATILEQTDADAGSILCLTFTNFAATNMKQRLQRLIGPASSTVNVRTFHSFAADIMNHYPEYFWNGARLAISPDSFQIDTVQSILAELPLDNPLASKFSGQFTALTDVQQALKLSKEAGLTPDKLEAMLSVNSAYIDVIEPHLVELLEPTLKHSALEALLEKVSDLPDQEIDQEITPLVSLSTVIKESFAAAVASDLASTKTTQTGAWKRKWLQNVDGIRGMHDERRRNGWWLAFADVYRKYRERLHGSGFYDYSDMVVEVISQLEQQPELRASVQEKYLYVLIDEFQDTNAAQLRLAHLVASHPTTENKPNLMAVGDDDQSIFAFNGAELNNMLTFKRTYEDTKLIVLTENYRSSQKLLDLAERVIAQAAERVVNREPGLSKNLIAKIPPKASSIDQYVYPTREHQLTAVAQMVARQWEGDRNSSVAILARNHASLREISAILNRMNIPIRYELQNDVLQHDAIKQVCLLAQIVSTLQEGNRALVNAGLAELLKHPMWGVSGGTMWRLAVKNYRDPAWLESLLAHEEQSLVALGEWLLWLSGEAAVQPLAVLMEYLLGIRAGKYMTSPLKAYYLLPSDINQDYLTTLSAVNRLLHMVNEFSTYQQGNLADFNRFIELNRQLERPIVDQSWFVSGDKAVELMTVHKAKGLEFDSVYLIDAIETNWQPRRISRKPPANLPLQPYGEDIDDYIRLMYVAITRAKQNFIATSYSTDGQGGAILATPLLANALEPQEKTPTDDPVTVLENTITWPRLETRQERALLAERLASYRLSPSGIGSFLDITRGGPVTFLQSHLLRIPEAQSVHAAFGTAIHAALQTAQRLTAHDRFLVPEVQQAYETALKEQALPAHDVERYLPHGKAILENLFTKLQFKLPLDGHAEIKLQAELPGDARLTGRLDNVHQTDTEIIITDYKTGTPLTSFATRDQTKRLKAWRHLLQLNFYALLVKASELYPASKAIRTRIVYVEAENTKQLVLEHTPSTEELQQLEDIISAVWKRIQAAHFTDTASYTKDWAGIERFTSDLLASHKNTAD